MQGAVVFLWAILPQAPHPEAEADILALRPTVRTQVDLVRSMPVAQPDLPRRSREEFRAPRGVRKSPKTEPAVSRSSYGNLRFRRVVERDRRAPRSMPA